MPAWPGSVSSTSIMQLVSEEAGEHGFGTVKPLCLGSRWSEGGRGSPLLLSRRYIQPSPGRLRASEGGGEAFNRSNKTLQLIKITTVEINYSSPPFFLLLFCFL